MLIFYVIYDQTGRVLSESLELQNFHASSFFVAQKPNMSIYLLRSLYTIVFSSLSAFKFHILGRLVRLEGPVVVGFVRRGWVHVHEA